MRITFQAPAVVASVVNSFGFCFAIQNIAQKVSDEYLYMYNLIIVYLSSKF